MVFAGLNAQQITVKEGNKTFGKDNYNSLSTIVYYSDVKTVEKEIKNFIKKYKGKASSKKGFIFGDDLTIYSLSSNTVDIYATATQIKGSNEVELNVAFDLGGIFLSSKTHNEQYQKASELIKSMALSITEAKYAGMLKEQEKQVKKTQKEYDNITKEITKLEKENDASKKYIEKSKREIEDSEKRISDNEKKIIDCKNNIKDKKSALDAEKGKYDKMKKDAQKIK